MWREDLLSACWSSDTGPLQDWDTYIISSQVLRPSGSDWNHPTDFSWVSSLQMADHNRMNQFLILQT